MIMGNSILYTKKNKIIITESKQRYIQENIQLYLIMLPVLLHIFIFHYIPMYGVAIAFQDYYPGSPFISFDGSVKWVGLKHFIKFLSGPYFGRLFKNTFCLAFIY